MKSSIKLGKIKAVLDTNIIVSALIAKQGASAKIFEKLILGEMINYSCREIVEELIEVFGRNEITKRTDTKARHFVIENYLKNSVKIKKKAEINLSEHSSDNKFIETAVDSEADYIVSGDQHLLKLKKFMRIRIINPKDFLEVLSKKGS